MFAANRLKEEPIIMETTKIEVKQEKGHFEYEDDNKNLLDIRYDIKVECDAGLDSCLFEATLNDDWCVQNLSLMKERRKSVSYEELLNYSILKCVPCCKTFTNRYQLLKHNLSHLSINIRKLNLFQCDDCLKFFLLRRKLINHIQAKHSNIPVTKMMHECHICSKVLSYSSWHAHMKEVHCKRLYKCEICGYRFKAQRYLKRHVIFKHQGVPRHLGVTAKGNILTDIKCELCPAILKNKNALKTHKRNCHSSEKFRCALCKIVFKSRPYLYCHLRRRHILDKDVFKCFNCNKTFHWKQMLDIHKVTCKFYKTV